MGSSYGIAYTSYVVRILQGRDIMQSTAAALPARAFVELCAQAGASGCQIDLSQIDVADASAIAELRADLEDRGLFVELSIPSTALESDEAFAAVASIAHALNASRLRVALLMGRRYELFTSMVAWREFTDRWRSTLRRVAPAIERTRVSVGIENHKDWLAAELADLLASVNSPNIGACVDFGNNLALLEDPVALVEVLAPWAVTTHLKDMAVKATDEGLLLSEVPLGEGVLPLDAMIGRLRQFRRDVHLVLEMITRDPLAVPYRRDTYWHTREPADRSTAEQIAGRLLERAHGGDLPHTMGLRTDHAIALEDEHIRSCTAYARAVLGL
jgi:sugar phosphate isomerase/epimerase